MISAILLNKSNCNKPCQGYQAHWIRQPQVVFKSQLAVSTLIALGGVSPLPPSTRGKVKIIFGGPFILEH